MRQLLQQASGSRVAVNLQGGDAISGQVDYLTRSTLVLADVRVIVGGAATPIQGHVLVPLAAILWVQVT